KAAAEPQSAPLRALADEYWDQRMEANPLEGAEVGEHRFDDRLPDLGPGAGAADRERLARLWARVSAVKVADLGPSDRATRALLLDEIDGELTRGACQLGEWAVDARSGPQVRYLRLPHLQPLATP